MRAQATVPLPARTVLGALQAKLDRFSPTQKRIGQFLLTRFDEAVFLTAIEMAKRCRTSEASVVRFARLLGYAGFPEFREDLQVLFREKVQPIDRMEHGPGIPRATEAIVDRVSEQAQTNIRDTRKLCDPRALQAAARAIAAARVRYVIGLNASVGVAELLGHHLRKILPHVRVLTEGGPILFDSILAVSPADVVIAFSFPRYAKWTVDVLRYAVERQAKTIAITDSRLTPVGQIASTVLVARSDSISFGCSYIAPMMVVDALVATLVNLNKKAALARLDAVEAALQGHDFFFAANPDGGEGSEGR